MFDKHDWGCLLLGLSVLAGCHPSRSEYIKLPPNPQHAKVQTPVLHDTPVPRRSASVYPAPRPAARSTPSTQTVKTWQLQSEPITVVQVDQPIMPMMLNEPVVEKQDHQLEAATNTKVDYTWIKSASPSPDSSVTQSSLQADTQQDRQSYPDSVVQQSYTLELLDVNQPQDDESPINATSVSSSKSAQIASVSSNSVNTDMSQPQSKTLVQHRKELLILLDVENNDQLAEHGREVTEEIDGVMTLNVDDVPAEKIVRIAVLDDAPADSLGPQGSMQQPRSSSDTQMPTQIVTSESESQSMDEMDRMIADLLATPAPVSEQTLAIAMQQQLEPDPKPQPVVVVKPDAYQIRKGDTLWSIAMRFYGNGQRWIDIARQNGIRQADVLHVGQTLRLPD